MPRIALELALAGAPARRLVFDKPEVIIGRANTADVVLDGDQISRSHCRLSFKEGRWRLADMGSANGVYLDRGGRGAPFLARNDVVVSGDHMYLGRYRLRVDLEGAESSPDPTLPEPSLLEDTSIYQTETQDRTKLVRPNEMRAEVDGWLQRPEDKS